MTSVLSMALNPPPCAGFEPGKKTSADGKDIDCDGSEDNQKAFSVAWGHGDRFRGWRLVRCENDEDKLIVAHAVIDDRQLGKTLNSGIVYGIADERGVPLPQAEALLAAHAARILASRPGLPKSTSRHSLAAKYAPFMVAVATAQHLFVIACLRG